MKRILLLACILIGVNIHGQNYTPVVPDGKQHQFISTQQIIRDTSVYLTIGQSSYEWNISIPWSSTKGSIDSAVVKIQCITGNKWSNYNIDSCFMIGTSGVCSFEDYMMNFDRIRVSINLNAGDTVTFGSYYRFVRKYSP